MRVTRPCPENREGGAAIVTVMMVMFVLLSFGAVSLTLTSHTVSSSARRRDRVAAVHAAEAGINEALEQLATASGATWCGLPASSSTFLPGGGGAGSGGQQFSVAVRDTNAADGPCTPADPRRVIVATGYSPSATATNPLIRRMQAEVRLLPHGATPAGYGFNKAMMTDAATALVNSATILGDGTGDNADVYSNNDVSLNNSAGVRGDVISQGSVTLGNNVNVYGDVYAAGSVTLGQSARVYGNVISAGGSVTLTNSGTVSGYIRAAGTISLGGNNWNVGSTSAPGPCPPESCLANSPTAPPPVETLPDFTWDATDAAWPQPVTDWSTCADFLAWLTANQTDFHGTHRISPSCGLTLSSMNITLSGDAAIVTDGWIRFENQNKIFENDDWKLFLISLHEGGGADPDEGIGFYNNSLIKPDTLIFARNTVTKSNSTTINGQIFATFIDVKNAYTLHFQQVNAPGFTFSVVPTGGSGAPPAGYRTQVLYMREVD